MPNQGSKNPRGYSGSINLVYILGISTYGGFEAKSATLDKEAADRWLESETGEEDTMAAYKIIDWRTAAGVRDYF